MTNRHRPEAFDFFKHNQFEQQKPSHAHAHLQNRDYHALAHNRHTKSAHDSADLVHHNKLPHVDLVHGGSPKAHPATKADKTHDRPGSPAHPEKLDNGMIQFGNLKGAAVDTDGAGAHRHKEDRTRQSRTSFTQDGKSLDTDHDAFVALPESVMKDHGIHLGDKGVLVRSDTGQKTNVIFGDVSSGKQWKQGQPEASVAALKSLGFDVNGARGVDKSVNFQLLMAPGSKNKDLPTV